jgi:hypothetical protein
MTRRAAARRQRYARDSDLGPIDQRVDRSGANATLPQHDVGGFAGEAGENNAPTAHAGNVRG